ncbi:hypothetical protein HMPREF1548_04559 [Clostridium sp. KLE 1755]|nr:hypothetical protein HMPREF1548_04559 [Clostridium sp. KLE 1755]
MQLCLLLFYPFRMRRLAESGNILQYITFRKFYKGNFLGVSRGGSPIMREPCAPQDSLIIGGRQVV